MVGAKVGICFPGGTIRVKGKNVRGHRSGILIARIVLNAIENGFQMMILKQAVVFEELVDGGPACAAQREAQQKCLVESGNAFTDAELLHDFAEISGQRSFPTKGVNAVGERCGDEFLETFHPLDAGIIRRQGERSHM